jgi:starvation-inducible DNA-binding protein
MNKEVVESLKLVLANSYALYLKTQNYHWNVTGPNFNSLHLLFNAQYNDLAVAVDDIAERIRTLDSRVEASFSHFGKTSKIKDGNENANATTMVGELAADNETLAKILKETFQIATKVGDDATADLIIGRIEIHQKNVWMLKSSL